MTAAPDGAVPGRSPRCSTFRPRPLPSPLDPDAAARVFAADPRNNVVLEASAGTGKTSVLVARYVNLLQGRDRPGQHPRDHLHPQSGRRDARADRPRAAGSGASARSSDRRRWLELRDRLGDIAISTIDAFCLSLLREFPLEADVDPAFDLADETEVPRLIATSLDRTLRILVGQARSDTDIALVLAQLGISRTREGLATLLDRRLVAWDALNRFLARGPRDLTSSAICGAAAETLRDTLEAIPGGLRTVRGRRSGRASPVRAVHSGRPPARQPARRAGPDDSRGARAGERTLPDQRGQGPQGHHHPSLQHHALPVAGCDEAPSRRRHGDRAAPSSRRCSRSTAI